MPLREVGVDLRRLLAFLLSLFKLALQGISRRLRRANPLGTAVEELEREMAGFESDFREFFPDLLCEFGAKR